MPNIYSIDASALIHGWRRDYPPDVFPGVWETLETLVESGSLISCEEVLLELERGADDLYGWASEREHIFKRPDSSVQQVVAEIVNNWPTFVPEDSHDGVWADPYVIALAVVHKGVVVTGERRVGSNARKPNIPNICDNLGVFSTNLLGLLRNEGSKF